MLALRREGGSSIAVRMNVVLRCCLFLSEGAKGQYWGAGGGMAGVGRTVLNGRVVTLPRFVHSLASVGRDMMPRLSKKPIVIHVGR